MDAEIAQLREVLASLAEAIRNPTVTRERLVLLADAYQAAYAPPDPGVVTATATTGIDLDEEAGRGPGGEAGG